MANSRRILRYEVPVDDQWHDVEMSGAILHVAARDPSVVEFWAIRAVELPRVTRRFRVFGTGQPLPEEPSVPRGSVVTADGQLVWHLMEGGMNCA